MKTPIRQLIEDGFREVQLYRLNDFYPEFVPSKKPLEPEVVATNTRAKAIVRILRDLKEVREDPMEMIKVLPLENDIFTWHISLAPPLPNKTDMFHPYRGLQFHMVLQFPEDYPHSPPKLNISTDLEHPNVFGSYICLDMLQGRVEANFTSSYRGGWSSAYTAYAILMQLQAFLFDEHVPQVHKELKYFQS